MSIITFTTDFGLKDPFVGIMKGVILDLNPRAVLVDLVHDLPPGQMEQAAFALHFACPFFPAGTIHVAVVDPGVGTDRRALAVRTPKNMFIAPDNGLLSYVLDHSDGFEARFIENPTVMRPAISRTFHGRDVFAPAAGHLSRGFPFEDVGPPARTIHRLPGLTPTVESGQIKGRVVYVDRFGNLITNIPNEVTAKQPKNPRLMVEGQGIDLVETYADVPAGALGGIPGSSGYLEIAVNQGRADQKLGVHPGAEVLLLGNVGCPGASRRESSA